MPTVTQVLSEYSKRFADAGIDSPRLNAELLLARTLDVDRGRLMGMGAHQLAADEESQFLAMAKRRLLHEPIDYILGERDFYGRVFRVRAGVLIPRPETETIIDIVRRECSELYGRAADIGCGSGALAVTLALELPNLRVLATDISETALQITCENAVGYGVLNRVFCARMNGLSAARRGFALIVSNPPYVDPADAESMQPEVREYEPPEALFGGRGGLEIAENLLRQAAVKLNPGGHCLFEHAFNQGEAMRAIASSAGLSGVHTVNDMSGLERVLVARK
jgi:release factor glutamine methyltransferase